jgi:methylthioribose-1-phosphate isomerase
VLSVEWRPGGTGGLLPGSVRILDQTKLPQAVEYVNTTSVEDVWHAIKTLQVRGAPAIGVAAAMGVVLAAQGAADSPPAVQAAVASAADSLATARPTAVNLFWALERMRAVAAAHSGATAAELKTRLAEEALAIRDEDAAMCRAIGEHGVALLRDGCTVLTHCNAGGLATAEFGTALAPLYVAHARGWKLSVYADETRPLLQGSRLTAWELMQAGIDVTVICDNMAAEVMKEGRIDAVLVGADRIAANGDTANKIGTYGVALLAQAHGIPFYVLAPTSTVDLHSVTGSDIPIEERDAAEITRGFGRRTAPDGARVYAPAFDVTPADLIAAIVCEGGIVRPPYGPALAGLADRRSISSTRASRGPASGSPTHPK